MSNMFVKDDLSKAIRLTAKHIGRDWSRLYWQLPFHPTRGREEISKDINHIDDKYHRGDVFSVRRSLSLSSIRIVQREFSWIRLGTSERIIE